MEIPEYLDKFEGILPEEVVFWTGAGISMASPTKLPSGFILTKESIEKFMPEGTNNIIKKIFTSGNFKDTYGIQKEIPRLELIIQTAYGVLGFNTFDYFSFMNIPSKYLNRYHIFFASHILAGGTHFTLNFDDGIEKGIIRINENLDPQIYVIDEPNLLNQKKSTIGKLIKLHGSLTKNELDSRIGLILNNITSGFDSKKSKNIINVIGSSKILCFIGYGGVDSFDVTPFFKKWVSKNELNNLVVLWIEYADYPEVVPIDISETRNAGKIILTTFQNAGANVLALKGNAETELIPFLEKKWKLRLPKIDTEKYNWKYHFDTSFERNPIQNYLKNLIAGQYASALGSGKLAVDFTNSIRESNLDTRSNSDNGICISHRDQCWFVYTNGLRDLGEYNKAIKEIKNWHRQIQKTPFNYFLINYRLMGEYRLKRNLLRTFIPFRNAKRSIAELMKYSNKGNLNQDELFYIARFYVDYLHLLKDFFKFFGIILHITKKPSVILKIILKIMEKHIKDAYINAYSFNKNSINNPHIFSDIANLTRNHFNGIDYNLFINSMKDKLPDFDEESLQMGTEAFLETDSLLGDINLQRQKIDERLSKNPYDRTIVHEINENISKSLSIYDYPGIWKAYYRLAKVHYNLKEFDKASENAQKALDVIDKVSYEYFYKRKFIKDLKKLIIKVN